MSIGTPGVGSNAPGQAGGPAGNQPLKPKGQVETSDSDAFDNAMAEDGKKKLEKEKELSPEEELKKMMAETSLKQFMEKSKEMTQEIKKNFEG